MHKKNMESSFSTLDKRNLNWLKYFIYGLWVMHIIYFLMTVVLLHSFPITILNKAITITLSIAIYGLGYGALSQPDIFSDSQKKSAYKRSGLSEEESRLLKEKLLDLMDGKKPYLDPELTLTSLSAEIDANRNHLSQLLNEGIGQNFYDFINTYRVEEVKRIMEEKSGKQTILSIAYGAGFNSKASFNAVFKKLTGLTPSQYMKKKF